MFEGSSPNSDYSDLASGSNVHSIKFFSGHMNTKPTLPVQNKLPVIRVEASNLKPLTKSGSTKSLQIIDNSGASNGKGNVKILTKLELTDREKHALLSNSIYNNYKQNGNLENDDSHKRAKLSEYYSPANKDNLTNRYGVFFSSSGICNLHMFLIFLKILTTIVSTRCRSKLL